jgi:hypothetical protein
MVSDRQTFKRRASLSGPVSFYTQEGGKSYRLEGIRISDFGFRISDFGFRISDFGFYHSDPGADGPPEVR